MARASSRYGSIPQVLPQSTLTLLTVSDWGEAAMVRNATILSTKAILQELRASPRTLCPIFSTASWQRLEYGRNILQQRKLSAASDLLSFLHHMQDTGTTQPTRHGAAAIQRCMGETADEQGTVGNASTHHPIRLQCCCGRKCFTGCQYTRHHRSLISAMSRAALHPQRSRAEHTIAEP